MLVTQPMLMSGVTPDVPTTHLGTAKWCEAHTAVDFTWDLTPSDHIAGLENGDYMVLIATTSTIDGGYVPVMMTGWDYLLRDTAVNNTSGARNGAILGRFYNSAAPTQTVTVSPAGAGDTCMILYAFRGVSRRKPVEVTVVSAQQANPAVGGSYPAPPCFYFPPFRPHKNVATAIHASFYVSTGNDQLPVVTASVANLLTDAHVVSFDSQSADGDGYTYQVYALVAVHRTDKLSNLTGSYDDTTQSMQGFSTSSGIVWTENGTPVDYDRMALYGPGNSVHTWTYEAAPVYCYTGDIISLMGCWSITYDAVIGTDSQLGLAIVTPSGDVVAQAFLPQVTTSFDPLFDGRADYGFCVNNGHSGLTALIAHVATENGEYTPRVYHLKEGQALAYSVGADSGTNYVLGRSPGARPYGAGVAVNSVPFIAGTFAAQSDFFSYGGYAPAVVILSPSDSTFTTNRGTGFLQQVIIEILEDDVDLTLYPTRMEPDPSYNGVLWDSAAQLSLDNAADQPRYAAVTSVVAAGMVLRASTGVMPTYRLTEGGADVDGKYYLEVTVHETTAASHTHLAVICNGADWTGVGRGQQANDRLNKFISVRGDGTVREFDTLLGDFGSMTAGDVFSFALDVKAGTCAVYKNNSLLYTADDSALNDPTVLPWLSWSFVATLQTSSTYEFTDVTFNFKGPFTYAKPAGYVAWDWPNEVA